MGSDAPRPPADDVERVLNQTDYVRLLARQLAGDGADADDLAQQTMVTALQHRPAAAISMRAWLRRVATRLQLRARRSRARKSRSSHQCFFNRR